MGDIADLYDYGYWPDEDFEEEGYPLRANAPAKCLHCGARLQWKQIDGHWKPHTVSGKRHLCKPFLESTRPNIHDIFKPIT